jgi:hypothetical protein
VPRETQEGATEQTPPTGSPESSEEPFPPATGSPDSGSREDTQQEALGQIPGLDDIRAVTPQVTVNIGVLAGSIHGGTVSAAGHSSRSGLGEATSQAGVTHWQVQAKNCIVSTRSSFPFRAWYSEQPRSWSLAMS